MIRVRDGDQCIPTDKMCSYRSQSYHVNTNFGSPPTMACSPALLRLLVRVPRLKSVDTLISVIIGANTESKLAIHGEI